MTYVVDVVVFGLGSMNRGAIGENNVKSNNLIHGKTPIARSIAIAAVGEVAANADTGASSMREGTLALVVDALCQVTQPQAAANLGDALVIEGYILELLKVDDHAAIFAAGAV